MRTAQNTKKPTSAWFAPNPAGNVTTLHVRNMPGKATVELVDLNGHPVRSQAYYFESEDKVAIIVSDLDAGSYFVRIQGEDALLVRKLVIQH
ncbi:MAG: T9SS type A sorting domain-containing protein [Bacteroidales bacterium]|nr:T9SS type A sorting domain-containing protein [Bacteroidales bacterium]